MEMAGFTSALQYARVRDFAYHDRHPLHYGVRNDPYPVNSETQEVKHHHQEDPNSQPPADTGTAALRQKTKDDIYRRAVALFDFEPENSNEARLTEGQVVWISYRHGQGWLVAENSETGETGLVPEEYVQVLPESDEEWVDT